MGEPVGFLVLRRDEQGRLYDDWDGVVHASQAAANESCIEGKQAGWDVFTVTRYSSALLDALDAKDREIAALREVERWARAVRSGYQRWPEGQWLEACGRRHLSGLDGALTDLAALEASEADRGE